MSKFGFNKVIRSFEAKQDFISYRLLMESKKLFTKRFTAMSHGKTFEGDKWKELSPTTVKLKQANKDRILIEFSDLRSALMNSLKTGNASWKNAKLVIINDYAIYHQEGTSKMKARKIFTQTPNLTKIQEDTLDKEILKLFK
jgi:hypothetical protein